MKVVKRWGNLLTLAALLVCIFISYLLSRKLYAPIQSLIGKLPAAAGVTPSNEYKLLDRAFHRMLDDVSSLNDKLTSIYPLALEQWLGSLLRFRRLPDELEVNDFLHKYQVTFDYSSFAMLLVRVRFTGPFFEEYSSADQSAARSRMLQTMKAVIPPQQPWIAVELENNVFGLVLNLPPQADRQAELASYLAVLSEHLHTDAAVQQLSIGVGQVHEGIEGLQQSYLEAMKAIWRISPFQQERVNFYLNAASDPAAELLTPYESKKIFHLLCSSKRDELFELLESIFSRNETSQLNDIEVKEMYLQIFIIGSQALQHKYATLPEGVYRNYIRVFLADRSVPINGIVEFVTDFFNAIMDALEPIDDEREAESIVYKTYIDTHYQEDIHLDLLADLFHTTPNYMSRLLKKELGRPFHQYLQELRIRKAKELLVQSHMSIQDIWLSVGFNNRNSFIRTFRKLEGIAPSDYRNQYSSPLGNELHRSAREYGQ